MIYGDNLRNLLEEMNKASRDFQNMVSSVQKKINEFQNLTDSMARVILTPPKSLIVFIEQYQKFALQMQKQLSAAYDPIFIQTIQKFLLPPEVAEQRKKAGTISKAGKILSSLGWWIFPDMTPDDFEKYIKWHEEDNDSMIQEVLITYYDNVEGIMEDWENNPELKKRIRILEDVIWAHKEGKYTLSVPSILPQIEGIIIEGTGEEGYIKQKEIPKLAEKLISQRGACNFRHYPLITFIESLIQANFEWGKSQEGFGRSPVLHGFFTDYDDREYSLKLILLFDYLQKFLSFRKEKS